MAQLTNSTRVVRVVNAQAAGATNVTGTVVDLMGFEGVRFIASFGALTATQVTGLKAQGGAAANGSDAADLAGTAVGPMADGDSNKMLVLDVYKPQQRYVRCVVTRGTANAVIDGVVAELYEGTKQPKAKDGSVSAQELWVSPAVGTA